MTINDLGILGDWYEDHGIDAVVIRNLLFVLPISGFGFGYWTPAEWYGYDRNLAACGCGYIYGYCKQYDGIGAVGNGHNMYVGRLGDGQTFKDQENDFE